MVLLAWVVSTVLAAGVAWAAVGAVGRGPDADGDVLSRAEAEAALEARRAAASPGPSASPTPTAGPVGPTASPDPTPTPTPTPTATTDPATPPDAVVRTWSVDGGAVSASCTGAAISLLYATASDGWAYEVKDQGPERVEVEFESGELEKTVRARCVGGAPEISTEDHSDGGDGRDDGDGGDDD